MTAPMGYEAIKGLAASAGATIDELIALARNNDPFYAGAPAHVRDAEWFATWWQALGLSGRTGVHLRAVHYRLVSQADPPVMPSGKPYRNTKECWSYLGAASKMARHLSLVPVAAFEDHRNPDPILHAPGPVEFAPSLESEWPDWTLPAIKLELADFVLSLPELHATGYEYDPSYQPYHLELWVEKSTMDPVLLPLCRRYGVNLVSSLGFQSISSVVALLRRVALHNKPTRVFYLSDFDPAGDHMPTAVARQIECWHQRLGIENEIKLEPLALTREQVITYQLPSIPTKESDRRALGFTGRYGMRATELDALEALCPGALARLVENAVRPYRDLDLEDTWEEAEEEADAVAQDAQQWVVKDSQKAIDAIQTEVQAVLKQYQDRVTALNEELQRDLGPLQERLQAVRHDIQTVLDQIDDVFELPTGPEPDIADPDDNDWLFDSGRTYLDQIAYYTTWKVAPD